MKSTTAQKLINKMQRDLMRVGIITNTLIEDLKKLRPYAIEQESPLLAKVIRLTFEHIERNGTFSIPIPEDEPVEEGTTVASLNDLKETSAEKAQESIDYLLSLIAESDNKLNSIEIREYVNALIAFEKAQ